MDGNSVLLMHGGNTVASRYEWKWYSHGMDSLLFSSGLDFPKSVLWLCPWSGHAKVAAWTLASLVDKDGYVEKEGERNRKMWVLSCSVCWLWNGMEREDPEEMKTMFWNGWWSLPLMGRGVRAMSLSQMDCGRCQTIGVQICWWMVHEMPLFTLKVGKLQKLWWREACRGIGQ